jgi:hypothetical protein
MPRFDTAQEMGAKSWRARAHADLHNSDPPKKIRPFKAAGTKQNVCS